MVALRPTSTISASSTKKLFSSKVSTKKGKIFHALEVEEYNENLTKVTILSPLLQNQLHQRMQLYHLRCQPEITQVNTHSFSLFTTSYCRWYSCTRILKQILCITDMGPLSSQINRILLTPICNACDGYKNPNHRKLCQRRRC